MRVEHVVRFEIKSFDLTPSEITEAVGIQPDATKPKAIRLAGGVRVPRAHLWALDSALGTAAPISSHIEVLVARLAPHSARVRGVINDRTTCMLTIIRTFHRSEAPSPLGFGLDATALQLLVNMHAELSVDEYDHSDDVIDR